MKAIVNVPICALLAVPTRESTLEDEALYGMVVDILAEPAPGWYRVCTHYRYEGIVCADDLIVGDAAADTWAALPKKIIRNKNFCDVLSAPKVQGWIMATLPRGGILSPVGQPEKGWQQVRLADGRTGFVPESILGEYCAAPLSQDEETLRQALVDAAMLYRGTHYRWGGKSPMGIDCSGLVGSAYLLNGVKIYRNASIREGFPVHEIDRAKINKGDLLFFKGHVAMYLGDGMYIHSTSKAGSDGVVLNSLCPGHPLYRHDLATGVLAVGSIF